MGERRERERGQHAQERVEGKRDIGEGDGRGTEGMYRVI